MDTLTPSTLSDASWLLHDTDFDSIHTITITLDGATGRPLMTIDGFDRHGDDKTKIVGLP